MAVLDSTSSLFPSSSTQSSVNIYNYVGKTAKFIVSGSAGLLVFFSEDWKPIYYIGGGVLNAILSKVIKVILRFPRPEGSPKDGYGMPSSHAQSLFYFFTVVTATLLQDQPNLYSGAFCCVLGLYACAASSWRITTRLHSMEQTIVGAILGVIVGYCMNSRELDILSPLSSISQHWRSLVSRPVPWWLKSLLLGIGGFVLYKKEIQGQVKKRSKKK